MNELSEEKSGKFWTWFIRNELELCDFRSSEDAILEVLLDRLHEVHRDFFFEVSVNAVPHELIITAQGKRSIFPVIDKFISSAPKIPSWKVIALKPPQGFDFVTSYNGVDYDPKSLWFLPLIKGTGSDSLLGLRVGIPELSAAKEKEAKFAVLIILDTALGERSAAEDIHYLEVCSLPSIPADEGFIEFTDLAKYIRWRLRGNGGTDPSTSSG